jgi:hypothetical protein
MTVVGAGDKEGERWAVIKESNSDEIVPAIEFLKQRGKINADLSVTADVASATPLMANAKVCCPRVKLFGQGFVLTRNRAEALRLADGSDSVFMIKPLIIARDLAQNPKERFVIDAFGLLESDLLGRFPAAYQWLRERVKPERDNNNRAAYRKKWWIFGEPRAIFRKSLDGLPRYIVTPETSKFKFFTFIDSSVISEGSLIVFSFDDPYFLGILSGRVHVTWALASGGRLGVGNDPRYNKTRCFDPYPFPDPSEDHKTRIRDLAERLDSHRKHWKELHPSLTMTGMYNVLAKLRSGEPLTDKDRTIHEQGLVSVLKQIHDDLDAAVFDAYGWPRDLTDDEILRRLVDLNRERAAEEARGLVRWLRPEFQNSKGSRAATQATLLPVEPEPEPAAAVTAPGTARKQPWPKSLAEQAQAVRTALATAPAGMTPEQLARTFVRGQARRVSDLLETLVSLGQARALDDGRYVRA